MRNPRGLLPAALTLVGLSFVVLATEPSPTRPVVAVAAPSTTATTTPPTPRTTAAIVTSTTAKPAPITTAAAPRVTTPRPPAPAATAPPVKSTGKAESCGWQWDAIRVDDGSSNEVTMTLDAARRPNESVTIFADFAGPDSPTAARTTTTDGAGEATVKFNVSEDKRDWTITISASFAAGGTCPPQTFTLDY